MHTRVSIERRIHTSINQKNDTESLRKNNCKQLSQCRKRKETDLIHCTSYSLYDEERQEAHRKCPHADEPRAASRAAHTQRISMYRKRNWHVLRHTNGMSSNDLIPRNTHTEKIGAESDAAGTYYGIPARHQATICDHKVTYDLYAIRMHKKISSKGKIAGSEWNAVLT